MRSSTRTELRALREVAHFLLPLLCCEFCGKPLLDPKLADKIFGNKAHTPLRKLNLTVHHRNGKHHDNRSRPLGYTLEGEPWTTKFKMIVAISGNKSLVHRKCHHEHEMKLNHHKRKVMKVKPLAEKAQELLVIIEKNLREFCYGRLPEKRLYTVHEEKFINRMVARSGFEKGVLKSKITRYEVKRLKKLAARADGRSDYAKLANFILKGK